MFKPVDGRKTHVADWLTLGTAEGVRPYLHIDLSNNRLPRQHWLTDGIGLTVLPNPTCEKSEGILEAACKMLFSLIRAWEPEWAAVDSERPRTHQWHPEKPQVFAGGWLVYLAPALAARLPLSNFSFVEEIAGGFLVKPAGDAFDPSNADHLAAVAKLDAALAELASE